MIPLLLAVSAAQPLPPTPRSFGDWMVGCDNRRDCEAVGFALPYDEDDIPFIGIIIDRSADGAAEPSIEIDQRFAELADYSGEVVADGKKTDLRFDKNGVFIGNARRFATVLAMSKWVTLVDRTGKTRAAFRTGGAAAALRWMDDRQRRAGTVTAMIARGSEPLSAVPPPPPLPAIKVPAMSSRPPRKLRPSDVASVRRRFDLCDDPRAEVEYHRLDAAHSMAIVNCWNGPYQSDGIIVLIPDNGRHRLAPIAPATAAELKAAAWARSRLIGAGYDPKARLLYSEYRGRGLNDCGSNASWAWDGTAFRLASYAALDECRGVTGRLPHWQTQNDPRSR